MKKILFLCTGNSCRSQMAEGFCRTLQGEQFESYSAGIESHGINPYAIEVMLESGVDISQQQSQVLSEVEHIMFDYVVAVCDNAAASCPDFSSDTKVIYRQFDDPPALAKNAQNDTEVLFYFRQVRDQIRTWIEQLPQEINYQRNLLC